MALYEYKPLIKLSLLYSVIVIICTDAQPLFQTILFFSTCVFHSALLEYSSQPLPLKKRPSGPVRGMTGVMQLSHGKSKPVRIHGMLGKHSICSWGRELLADGIAEAKMVRIEIGMTEVSNRWRQRRPQSPHILHVRTWP